MLDDCLTTAVREKQEGLDSGRGGLMGNVVICSVGQPKSTNKFVSMVNQIF